jgi:NADPH:quinone reductase-like Zn-dependent oxidoreductase
MREVVIKGFGGIKYVKVLKKKEKKMGEGEVIIRVKECGMKLKEMMVSKGEID